MPATGNPHSVAKYRGREGKYADTLSDGSDDDDMLQRHKGVGATDRLSISATTFMSGAGHTAFPGGPFSALSPSMCPQDVIARLQAIEDSRDQPEYRFDEFGFKVEVEDGPEENSSKILSIPFVEDPQHRLRWIAHLEFTHNHVVEELTWDKVEPLLPKSDKLKAMVRAGIPHSLRPFVWPRLCGSLLKKRGANFSYKEIVKANSQERLLAAKQIEKDLLRTMPTNACFMTLNGTGIHRLRRILRAIAYLYPDIGYCQGMGVVVCCLLLVMEEEDAFWMMASVVEDLLPGSYYCNSLVGVQADQKVLQQLMATFLPDVNRVLQDHDIEFSLISLHWFLTLFSSAVHLKVLVRLWDVFFYEGSVALFQFTLGMLRIRADDVLQCENSAQLFNLLSDLPQAVEDADYLLDVAFKIAPSITESNIISSRKKHLAYLMADQGVLINPEADANLPKQTIQRRKLRRSQSFMSQIFRAADSSIGHVSWDSADEISRKNVRQTEILVDLKDAILKVARHFMSVDPSNYGGGQQKIVLAADYSSESHARDHENFLAVHRSRCRRARALLDFERHDDDELGFRKNDIITIISQKDEHCWIGELNGLRGWFPAKFVELLDERSKSYSVLGDDSVSEVITDLVRGVFCPSAKTIFEHGIKRSAIIGGPVHPWLFIEDVARREVAKDFDSVYSRLVLCRTYRLDEDGKVLTPEELLYKAVEQINFSHDAKHAQMDVKLRSLICVGLNEQVLHLWFELLCSCPDTVRKWYHRWSFIRSPGWVQIKCELRILSQFAFNLSPDWEIHGGTVKREREVSKPLREGVRDMLVKHHLFSWDL